MYLANSVEPPKIVSSDFGKLDVMRHLISGEDCAIAGEATADTAAPAAETFKKSRRFIKASPCWGVPKLRGLSFGEATSLSTERAPSAALTRKPRERKRDKGMTAPIKRKSHMRLPASLRRRRWRL